ncbi:ABC transporter ATP-binding protein [Desulfoferrobacter suflitae]|uniref:ABC transporter ATP-binding protein n=1 Tax=Desulfoferrobacter suflitae TaxID=2865782 RepID=UPI002164C5E9|nr:ABC transporter ATP-binding protein [Desulfoferrobacter suflitae]MCK8603556.1 ABC transporter ATP-binding protein [Desulfoferrobacter suflitae]
MLEVREIQTFYGGSQILFGMNFAVHAGEMVSLLGRNGMGKTTTVRSIMGLTPARAGAVYLDGIDITRAPPFRIAQSGVSLAPEDRQVFPTLTVRENLVATAARNHHGAAHDAWTIDRVMELFPILRHRQNHLGSQLSGGEQQMVAIGRALMTNPRLLILDEATEGLAPLVRREIWRCLNCLKESGLSILIIDKSVEVLMRIADRHYIVEKGRVVWSGGSHELAAHPEVLREYLGV